MARLSCSSRRMTVVTGLLMPMLSCSRWINAELKSLDHSLWQWSTVVTGSLMGIARTVVTGLLVSVLNCCL